MFVRSTSLEQTTRIPVREMSMATLDPFILEIWRTLTTQGCFPFCSRVRAEPASFIGLPPPHLWLLYPKRFGKGLFIWTQAPSNWCPQHSQRHTSSSHGLEGLLGLWAWICSKLMLNNERPSLRALPRTKRMTCRTAVPSGLEWRIYSKPLLQNLAFSFQNTRVCPPPVDYR